MTNMVNQRTVHMRLTIAASLVILLNSSSCEKTNPVEPTDPYPERANYDLVLESGSSVDSTFILVVDGNGKNLRRVPSPHAHATWPLVSPDRKFIAFRPGIDFLSLFIYNFATGQSTSLLNDRNWDEYAWAPTSNQIVYSGDKTSGGFVIKIVNLTSGGITLITDSIPGSERYPHWLPNGNTIAFSHYDNVVSPRILHSYDLATNQIRQLVEGQREVSWSPDGTKFFANEKVYSWPNLNLIKDISSLSPGSELFVRWFPNSQQLLVQAGVPDEGLYKLDILSGVSEKIISGPITFKAVSISADGKLIAFIPGSSDNGRFIVSDSIGKAQQSISLPIPGANYRRIQFVGDIAW